MIAMSNPYQPPQHDPPQRTMPSLPDEVLEAYKLTQVRVRRLGTASIVLAVASVIVFVVACVAQIVGMQMLRSDNGSLNGQPVGVVVGISAVIMMIGWGLTSAGFGLAIAEKRINRHPSILSTIGLLLNGAIITGSIALLAVSMCSIQPGVSRSPPVRRPRNLQIQMEPGKLIDPT